MIDDTPKEVARPGAERPLDGSRRSPAEEFLDVRRPFRGAVPDSSVGAVRKVARLDARTHIIAARVPGGSWFRLRTRSRFTRDQVRRLRAGGVSEVVLRRGFSRASFPLAWLSQRAD